MAKLTIDGVVNNNITLGGLKFKYVKLDGKLVHVRMDDPYTALITSGESVDSAYGRVGKYDNIVNGGIFGTILGSIVTSFYDIYSTNFVSYHRGKLFLQPMLTHPFINIVFKNGKSVVMTLTTNDGATHYSSNDTPIFDRDKIGETLEFATSVLNPPVVISHPAPELKGAPGDTFVFTAGFVTTGKTLTYQWYMANGLPVNGWTAPIISWTPNEEHDNQFRCKATDQYGLSTFTNWCHLSVGYVIVPPIITTQPIGATVVKGGTHVYTVITNAGHGTLHYQWYFNGEAIDWNESTLTTTASVIGNYPIYCVVSNEAGSVTSDTVTQKVIAKPTLTANPANTSATTGQNYSFSVSANANNSTLSYQWYNGQSGAARYPVGGNSRTLTTHTINVGVHSYWCKISNEAGSTNSGTGWVTVAKPWTGTVTVGTSGFTGERHYLYGVVSGSFGGASGVLGTTAIKDFVSHVPMDAGFDKERTKITLGGGFQVQQTVSIEGKGTFFFGGQAYDPNDPNIYYIGKIFDSQDVGKTFRVRRD